MTMVNPNENFLSVVVEIGPCERLRTGQSREHTLLVPWTTELVLCFQSSF